MFNSKTHDTWIIMDYVVTGYLMVLSIIDVRRKKVPLMLIVLPMLLTTVYCIVHGDINDGLFGILPGLWLCALSLFLPGSLGVGDGMLAIIYGQLFGWKLTCMWFLFGLLLAAVFGVCIRLWKRCIKEIPLIPFLTVVHIVRLFI